MEIILIIAATLFAIYLLILIFTKPSNHRNWTEDQKILPYAEINDNLISIYNIRNFKYESEFVYAKNYYDKTFDLNKIKSVDFILTPFSNFPGVAHTFLSFGFDNDEYVAVSIEIRKKVGDEYSALKGLLNQYEIMYVVADEQDVVKLRTNHRKNNVYIYPIKSAKEKKQALFLEMIKEINELKNKPKFYNTITTSCSVNIMRHVNSISSKKIPFSYKVIMPRRSDEIAFSLGLIDTDLPLEKARETFLITEKAQRCDEDQNFSKTIRMWHAT